MVDDDRFAAEGALLVGVGCQLDGFNRAVLFRDDGPKVAIVAGHSKNQEGFQSAGIEVRKEDSRGVQGQAGGGGVAIGGCVEHDNRGMAKFRLRNGCDVDGRTVDSGAQLHLVQMVGRG